MVSQSAPLSKIPAELEPLVSEVQNRVAVAVTTFVPTSVSLVSRTPAIREKCAAGSMSVMGMLRQQDKFLPIEF